MLPTPRCSPPAADSRSSFPARVVARQIGGWSCGGFPLAAFLHRFAYRSFHRLAGLLGELLTQRIDAAHADGHFKDRFVANDELLDDVVDRGEFRIAVETPFEGLSRVLGVKRAGDVVVSGHPELLYCPSAGTLGPAEPAALSRICSQRRPPIVANAPTVVGTFPNFSAATGSEPAQFRSRQLAPRPQSPTTSQPPLPPPECS